MPKIDIAALPVETGSGYPGHRAALMDGRSQEQDEFLVVTEGTCTLIDDDGQTVLAQGDCAAFPAGEANGHMIQNRHDTPAAFVVVGTRTKTERGHYSDEDMMVTFKDGEMRFSRKDGSDLDED